MRDMERVMREYAGPYRAELTRRGDASADGKTEAHSTSLIAMHLESQGFPNTDTFANANLTRHIEFIRHSDLSDGPACHDEVIRRA